jgi:mono/diheme cytochrome c family protein
MKRNGIFLIALAPALVALWLLLAPPRWWLNLTKPVDLSDPVKAGERIALRYDCRSCHQIDGRGSLKASNLSGVTERLDRVSLRIWLSDPTAVDSRTAMPNFKLSDPELDALIAYLSHLDQTR